MQDILTTLNSRCGWDCVIKSFDGWNLKIISGSAPEYALPLATFGGVSYVACPMEFSHPLFRLASGEERAEIGRVVALEEEEYVVVIEAETMASLEPHVFFLVAESVSIEA